MNRLARRVARLEAQRATEAATGAVVAILEAGRRAHRDGTHRPPPRQTLEELRAEIARGGWRATLAEARARVWHFDEFVRGGSVGGTGGGATVPASPPGELGGIDP